MDNREPNPKRCWPRSRTCVTGLSAAAYVARKATEGAKASVTVAIPAQAAPGGFGRSGRLTLDEYSQIRPDAERVGEQTYRNAIEAGDSEEEAARITSACKGEDTSELCLTEITAANWQRVPVHTVAISGAVVGQLLLDQSEASGSPPGVSPAPVASPSSWVTFNPNV